MSAATLTGLREAFYMVLEHEAEAPKELAVSPDTWATLSWKVLQMLDPEDARRSKDRRLWGFFFEGSTVPVFLMPAERNVAFFVSRRRSGNGCPRTVAKVRGTDLPRAPGLRPDVPTQQRATEPCRG